MVDDMAERNAEQATRSIFDDVDDHIDGSPEMAVIMAAALFCSAEIIMRKYRIRKEILTEIYSKSWTGVADRILRD